MYTAYTGNVSPPATFRTREDLDEAGLAYLKHFLAELIRHRAKVVRKQKRKYA